MNNLNITQLRRRSLSLLLCGLLSPLSALADQVVVADPNGNELTYTFDADGPATFYGISKYAADEAKAGRIVIAASVTDANGKSHEVKYVGGSVRNRDNLVSVTFGQNIVAVGGADGTARDAFYYCRKLQSVTLNAKLQTIGTMAFQGCSALESLNLGSCTQLTTIKNKAFENCDQLRQLAIPAKVATIEESAFNSIDSLRTVTLATGSRLDYIGQYAFYGCTALERINLEAATQLKHLMYRTFYNCRALQHITIPASVEDFGDGDILGYCLGLETITWLAAEVPNGIYRSNNAGKLTTINIGAGVKRIGSYAFANNYHLKQVNIDAGVSDLVIDEYAFSESDSLISVTLPKGVTSLGKAAFRSCDCLQTFTFAEGSPITNIPGECFYYCPSLQKLALPNTVKTVENGAFGYCRELTEISFGTALEQLANDYYLFSNCEKLQKVTLPGVNYPFPRNIWMPDNVVLYVHADLADVYRTNDFTKNYRIIPIGAQSAIAVTTTAGGQLQGKVPEDLAQNMQELTISGPINGTDINYLHSSFPVLRRLDLKNARIVSGGDKYNQWDVSNNGTATVATYNGPWETENNVVGYAMFYNMPMLEAVVLPNGITRIGDYAFAQDRIRTFRLAEVNIPSTVTEIGRYAFHFAGLKNITIPSGVKRIEEYTFWHCEKLQKASLPNGITYIGGSAFSEDYELLDVNIPTSVETIDEYAFYNNYKRQTPIAIPNSCTTIGYQAFRSNRVAPSVTFGNSLQTISSYAFADCYLIEQAVLPQTVTRIGDNAFYNCDSLRSFRFPQNIKQVEGCVLESCDALTTVALASGTTSIGESAFNGCKRLATINLAEQSALATIGNYAFYGTALKDVVVPNNVTEIGWAVFQDCKQLQSINVPTGIDYVPYDYCEGCESLTTVAMHPGINTIRHDAFYGCKALKSIEVGNNITSIEYNAFRGCESLPFFQLPQGLTAITSWSFAGMKSFKGRVVVPEGVKTVEGDAFRESNILGISFPEGITSWGTDICYHCDSLTTVRLPQDMTRIPNYMFQDCPSLTGITIPDAMREIGYAAFQRSGLTSIVLPDELSKIESYAFSHTQLQSFRVPDGITTAPGSYFLEYCKHLKTVHMGRNEDVEEYTTFTAMNGCDSLQLLRLYFGTPPKCYTGYMGYRKNCVLEVPEEQIALYQQADGWKEFKEIRGFYTGDVLRELDYAVLQTIYSKLDGKNWTNKWDLANDHHAAGKWKGVTTAKVGGTTSVTYAITAIDLSGQGLTGQLPDSIFMLRNLQSLNLSNNALRGDLGQVLVERDLIAPTITDVNLMGNQLTGDASAFLSRLPNVAKADLSYNRLTAFSEPLPNTILTDRNLSKGYQFIDYKTKEVVVPEELDAEAVVDLTPGIPAAIEWNSLQTYRHDHGDHGYIPTSLYRYYRNSNGSLSSSDWELQLVDGLWGLYAGNSNYVLTAPKGQPAAYTHGDSWWCPNTYILRFDWQDGDVNADQTVDALDLQSVIYYALNDRKPNEQLYNFTAADDNGDKKINVADIIGSVDYILGYEQPAATLARSYNIYGGEADNLLSLSAEGLTLHNSAEAAALQFTVYGATQGQLRLAADVKDLFSVAMRPVADGVRVVVYSPQGRTLAPGSHSLLKALPAGAAIGEVVLSDPLARRLGIVTDGTTTAVRHAEASPQHEGPVFDLNGRRLNATWEQLPKGIYLITVDGKQIKVKK